MTDLLTLQEVADFLKVHRNTVYRLARKGRIPAFKIGSDWRFRRQAIEAWLEARREDGSPNVDDDDDDVFHVAFWLLTQGVGLTVASGEVANVLDVPTRAVEREMRSLVSRGVLSDTAGGFALTPEGLELAHRRFASGRRAPAGHASVVAFASRQIRARSL